MRQTLRLGQVAGIPVGVHWSVLVVMVLLGQGLAQVVLPQAEPGRPQWSYWVVALAATVLFVASLLAHELAHALVATHYRMRVERVTLWLLGGVAELGGRPPGPREKLRVAAVGPLTSLAASAVFFMAAVAGGGWLPAVVIAGLSWLAGINLLLAVFNLLPAAPLDGGRVLSAMLWLRWRDETRAEVAAARAGRGLGAVLVGLAVLQLLAFGNLSGVWFGLLGWFVIVAATAEQQTAELTARLGGLPVRAAMDPYPTVGLVYQGVQEFLDTVATRSRQLAFPVVDPAGHPVGTVQLAALAAVGPAARPTTALGAVMAPLGPVIEADRPLIEAVALLGSPAAAAAVLVVDHGALAGVLDTAGVARAIDLARLGVLAR